MKYIATSVVAMLLLSGCDNTQSNNSSPSETEVGVVTLKSQPVSVVDWPPESPDNQYHLFK